MIKNDSVDALFGIWVFGTLILCIIMFAITKSPNMGQ